MNLEDSRMRLSDKSRFTAAVLQMFCGCIGLGRFYLGYITYAVLQILFSLITFGFGGFLWGFADGILILNGTVKTDGDGNYLN